ncbi:MAG: gamma-glutamylcyclotransferase [Deltaproteobacteria bacterium]|nr:gamma-glutamylcyclotransferase [Deltaproteobacteria bacterium]
MPVVFVYGALMRHPTIREHGRRAEVHGYRVRFVRSGVRWFEPRFLGLVEAPGEVAHGVVVEVNDEAWEQMSRHEVGYDTRGRGERRGLGADVAPRGRLRHAHGHCHRGGRGVRRQGLRAAGWRRASGGVAEPAVRGAGARGRRAPRATGVRGALLPRGRAEGAVAHHLVVRHERADPAPRAHARAEVGAWRVGRCACRGPRPGHLGPGRAARTSALTCVHHGG